MASHDGVTETNFEHTSSEFKGDSLESLQDWNLSCSLDDLFPDMGIIWPSLVRINLSTQCRQTLLNPITNSYKPATNPDLPIGLTMNSAWAEFTGNFHVDTLQAPDLEDWDAMWTMLETSKGILNI